MAIYSEVISNAQIKDIIPAKCQNILIVACGGCVNESLAYTNNVAIFEFLEDGVAMPYAVKAEAERLSEFLVQQGFKVQTDILVADMPILCIHRDGEMFCENLLFTPDIVFALSCPSGALALEPFVETPVVSIAVQKGYLAYTFQDTDDKRFIITAHIRLLSSNAC